MNKYTTQAIDLGSGNVKVTTTSFDKGIIQCKSFPAIAVEYDKNNLLTNNGSQNNLIITDNGKQYLVGQDIHLHEGKHETRILSSNYIDSPEYRILSKAALFEIDKSNIDLLTVGLPVNNYTKTNDKKLRDLLIGTHQLPGNKICKVCNLQVLPQPVGALFHYAFTHTNITELNKQTNLLIDVGFYTLDWAIARGIEPISKRCGSYMGGGIGAILNGVAQRLKSHDNVEYTNISRLENDIQSGFISLYGNKILADEYLDYAMRFIKPAFTALTNELQESADIDNIILVGGPAPLYKKYIQNLFPRHKIITMPDSHLSNVRGFQIAGEIFLKHSIGDVA